MGFAVDCFSSLEDVKLDHLVSGLWLITECV